MREWTETSLGVWAEEPAAALPGWPSPRQRSRTVDGELARSIDFMLRGDMGGTRTEASAFGRAVYDDEVPLRVDSNYLLASEVPPGTSAAELLAEARRLERPAIMVPDQLLGEPLIPAFDQLGWTVHRGLVMAQRRQPRRAAKIELVQELGEDALRPARRGELAGEPWASPEVVDQLLHAKLLIGRRLETRFFAVVADGRVLSYADLYTDGQTGQIEDVATVQEFRGRGYASAVVLRAAEEARLAGCDLVFLVADADDWPKALYERLGFDGIGGYVKFIRPSQASGGGSGRATIV